MAKIEKGRRCVVCGDVTAVVFNIKFKRTPICESCASTIALQQVTDLVSRNWPVTYEDEKCPDCGGLTFLQGPQGVMCRDCGSTFEVLPTGLRKLIDGDAPEHAPSEYHGALPVRLRRPRAATMPDG